jgi:hypothetical protein
MALKIGRVLQSVGDDVVVLAMLFETNGKSALSSRERDASASGELILVRSWRICDLDPVKEET